MKQTVSEQALALVEKKIPQTKGELTPQDAATATGITLDEARDALSRLMELYVTRVTYDEQGNLLFAFEYPLRRRGTKTAAEKWAGVKEKLWRGFKVAFKIWIGLMVVVYFVIMLVVLLALILAQGSNDRDRRSRRGDDAFAGIFRVMMEGLQFAFWTRAYSAPVYAVDDYGYRYRTVQTPRGKNEEKSFIIAIYDLAIGPERVSEDPLANEQEVAAYLRSERGVLAPAEIVALSGVPMAEAEERMADYLVRFKGDPIITDDGVVIGQFEEFVAGTAAKTDAKIVPYWDEYEAPYEHSGNSSGRNAAIIAMVAFTAVMGAVILGADFSHARGVAQFATSGLVRVLLGYVPLLFTISYLLVSFLRLGPVRKREAERVARNHEKKVMRVIFQQRLWRATADQIYFSLVSTGEKDLKKEQVATILQGILPKLQGDLELNDDGEPVYNFDRLRREIESTEKMRAPGR
jgi:hypothetical protein